MSPLVFALLFVIAECVVFIVYGSLLYARHKSRLEEIDHAGGIPSRSELAERLIAAHQAIKVMEFTPGAEQMLGAAGREKVIETLRGLAVRLECNDSVSPLYTDQVIRLCTELAAVPPLPPRAERPAAPEPAAAPAFEIETEPVAEPAKN